MILPEILDHYADGREESRLSRAAGRLERLRTWEIMDRHLPLPPARVLDVGGGTGVYAVPLAERGYRVDLVDAVPLHVERARQLAARAGVARLSAEVGDARCLQHPDATFDVVLLLGPLYHLVDREDRVRALAEARRVLVAGGLLLSAYISRFASACDGIRGGDMRNPEFAAIVDRDLTDGIHRNIAGRPEWFTTAYFHRPEDVAPEIDEAGLLFAHTLAVEGPGWLSADVDAFLDNGDDCERLLGVLRRVEREPTLLGASAHLMAVARR